MGSVIVFRDKPFPEVSGKRKVLVTGAAGRIGSFFAEHAHDWFDFRLLVRGDEPKIEEIKAFGEVVVCNLEDLSGLKDACAGIDTVVHLAADHRTHAPWESLLPNNIIGTYNMFEAAEAQGCRRVVYASTVQAVSSHPAALQLRPEDPVNPGNLYGVSKCFGEAMCRCYSNRGNMSAIALRIAAFQTFESMHHPDCDAPLWAFVSHRDLAQLIRLCVDDLRLKFGIFYGLSNNEFSKVDTSNSRELLGYAPVDDIFAGPTPE